MERWTEVDRTKDPTHFVRYLDSVSALDATAQYKRRSFRLLEPRDGDRFLEVGCGNGDDARELAQLVAPSGGVTAIDVSQTMVDEAARRGTEGVDFALGDAHELRYADASFDGVRVDRTLQHVADPAKAMTEMARVLKPGRRLVAAEPDWDTLLLAATDTELTRRVLAHKTDQDHRNGTIGRRLPGLMVDAGLRPVVTEATALFLTDLKVAMVMAGLRESALSAARARVITNAEATEWLADLERQGQRGAMLLTITVITVAAEKP